jgi:hypothetical protein
LVSTIAQDWLHEENGDTHSCSGGSGGGDVEGLRILGGNVKGERLADDAAGDAATRSRRTGVDSALITGDRDADTAVGLSHLIARSGSGRFHGSFRVMGLRLKLLVDVLKDRRSAWRESGASWRLMKWVEISNSRALASIGFPAVLTTHKTKSRFNET